MNEECEIFIYKKTKTKRKRKNNIYYMWYVCIEVNTFIFKTLNTQKIKINKNTK